MIKSSVSGWISSGWDSNSCRFGVTAGNFRFYRSACLTYCTSCPGKVTGRSSKILWKVTKVKYRRRRVRTEWYTAGALHLGSAHPQDPKITVIIQSASDRKAIAKWLSAISSFFSENVTMKRVKKNLGRQYWKTLIFLSLVSCLVLSQALHRISRNYFL